MSSGEDLFAVAWRRGREARALTERETIPLTDDVVRYVSRFGGRCRDCADEAGVCPGSGLPCDSPDKAIRHVIAALNYGFGNGYLPPAALAQPDPLTETSGRVDGSSVAESTGAGPDGPGACDAQCQSEGEA